MRFSSSDQPISPQVLQLRLTLLSSISREYFRRSPTSNFFQRVSSSRRRISECVVRTRISTICRNWCWYTLKVNHRGTEITVSFAFSRAHFTHTATTLLSCAAPGIDHAKTAHLPCLGLVRPFLFFSRGSMSGFEGPSGKAYAVMETDGIITSTSQQQVKFWRRADR